MATIDNVKRDYLAINRTAVSDAQAQAYASAIDAGTITEAQFVSSQIAGAKQTTQAEVATYAFLTGNTPSSAQLDSLVSFAKAQTAYYTAQGYQANLAPFEALGAAIASDATASASFVAKYPITLSNTDFVSAVYTGVNGGIAPSFTGNPAGSETTNGDHFIKQLIYYTNLYQSNGISAAQATLMARGAVAADIVALAFIDPTVAANSTLDDQTVQFLTNAAAGTATYGAPLPIASSPGSSFVFTTGVDNLTGTAGSDTFTADNTDTTKLQLSTADSVNGGGGIDTLKVFLAAATTAVPLPSTLTSIENIFTNGGAVTSLDVSKLAGVTGVQVDAPVANTAETITVANQAVTLSNFASTANTTTTITSTTDTTENITLSKFTATGANVNTLALTGAALTSATINSVGGANAATLTNTPALLTSLNITGDQKLTLTETLVGLKTINASTATGSVNVDLSGFGGTDNNLTFTGGAGNDSVKFKAAFLTATDVLDGGAGTDTLIISDTAPVYAGINAAKNFEILGLGATGATLDASQITNGIKEFSLTTGTETINNLGAGSIVDINGATTAVTLGGAIGNSTTSINLGTATGAGFTTASLTENGITTTNLKVLGTSAQTITALADPDGHNLVITGSTDLTITNALAGTTTGQQVDASAFTGKLTLTGSGVGDIIKMGTGGGTVAGGAGGDQLFANTGADKFVYTTLTDSVATTASAGTDVINSFTAGSDKFKVATVPTTIQQGAAFTAAGTGALSTDIGNAVAAGTATFGVNNAAVVNITGGTDAGTYVVINDGTAGYIATDDAVIKMVGLTGTLAVTDFTTT